MSKEADIKRRSEHPKRRRRKGGGLRVPSDEVPRNPPAEAVNADAPAPEDPRLAVSVAYAFTEGEEHDNGTNAPVVDELDGEHEPRELVDEDGQEEFGEATVEMPAAVGLVPESVMTAAAQAGDSVDIAFDEEDEGEDAGDDDQAVVEVVGEAASEPAGETFDEGPEELDPQLRAQPGGRARTVALSDADLEELMEGELNPEAEARDLESAESKDDFDTRKTVQLPALGADAKEELEVDEPQLVSEVEDRDVSESGPLAPLDAGDSGELISDDLLEEIDDGSAAKPVEEVEDGEEPLDPDEEEIVAAELAPAEKARPEVAEPPPPPTTKPPPAPSGAREAAVAAVASPQPKARRRKGKPWFDEIFDEDYLRTLPFLTPQATQFEAAFVMESLGLEPGAQVLDVGCGYGRHAMELAARGFHVVGLDSSLPLLLRGADEAQRRSLTINFVHGDMREMGFDAQFDGAYCLFSTFGYFDDETNKKTAQNIARALKPGGRLVLEVLNRDYVVGDLPARVWWEGDGCVVLEEVDFNYFGSRVVSNRSVVFDDGRQLEQEISLRAFALHELGKLLHSAGFRVVEISGSMTTRGRFFGAQSRDIVVVAERRAEKQSESKSA